MFKLITFKCLSCVWTTLFFACFKQLSLLTAQYFYHNKISLKEDNGLLWPNARAVNANINITLNLEKIELTQYNLKHAQRQQHYSIQVSDLDHVLAFLLCTLKTLKLPCERRPFSVATVHKSASLNVFSLNMPVFPFSYILVWLPLPWQTVRKHYFSN